MQLLLTNCKAEVAFLLKKTMLRFKSSLRKVIWKKYEQLTGVITSKSSFDTHDNKVCAKNAHESKDGTQ